MAKYSSGTKAGSKRKGSKINYMDIQPGSTVADLVAANKGKPKGTIADLVKASKPQETLSADEVTQEVADVTGETRGEVKTRAQQSPMIYQEVQDYAGQDVNLAASQETLGVGPGYQSHDRVDEYSKVGRFNTLGKLIDEGSATPEQEAEFVGLNAQDVGAKTKHEAADIFDPANPDASLRGGQFAKDTYTYDERLNMGMESWSLGRKVQAAMEERFEFGLNPVEEAELSAVIQEHGIEPRSLKDWMNRFASNYAQVKERGVPEALSDLALHSVLQVVRENMRRSSADKVELENAGDISPQQKEDEARRLRAGDNQRIGKLMEAAMGVQSTDTTSAIAGAVALESVTKALNEGGLNNLFIQDADGRWAFNPDKVEQMEGMQDLTNVLLPQTRKEVRNARDDNPSDILAHRKADKNLKKSGAYKDATFLNKTIDTLKNQAHTLDGGLAKVVNMLAGAVDQNTGGSLIDRLIGIKINEDVDTGYLNSRENSRRKLGPDGLPIANPDFIAGSQEFDTKYPYVMERYLGNTMKDIKFNETMDWVERQLGNAIYYDYFPGSNNRFYVEQTVGNPQSDKLARALLQSPIMRQADIRPGSKQLILMKAGIMKKAGIHLNGTTTDKMNVADAAAAFDQYGLQFAEAMQGVNNGQADAFIKLAADAEGWMTASAMVEGAKLYTAMQAGEAVFNTNFYTEIDGVANGLGHNAMQAGDPNVAVATNLNPLFDAIYKDKGYTTSGLDVYGLAGNGMFASLKKGVDENSPSVLSGLNVLNLSDKASLRAFAKTPLMIFGYGAGPGKIAGEVGTYIDEMLNKPGNESMRPALMEALGDVDLKTFKEALGDAMIIGVGTNFPQIKELSQILSRLADEAVKQGIDPSVVTVEGHAILLGLDTRGIDEELSFVDQGLTINVPKRELKAGGRTKKITTKSGSTFPVETRPGEMEKNPKYDPTKPKSKFNSEYREAGHLKAATQAAVLMTHANDGINIGRSFNATTGKIDAFQIFDGVMVSPLQAAEMADQLNRDFVALNKEESNLERFMKELGDKGMKFTKLPGGFIDRISAIKRDRRALIARIKKVNQFFWD